MWIYTRHGFFSAVQHNKNPDIIHVRARFEGDIERLCKAYGLVPVMKETPGGDYRYRCDFERKDWAYIVQREAEAIDYPNFKNAVHDGTIRDCAYLDCWRVMREAQEGRSPIMRRDWGHH